MSNGYGSSSSGSSQSTPSVQAQVAPPGFHYMPDGTLMSDAEHVKLYGEAAPARAIVSELIINDFIVSQNISDPALSFADVSGIGGLRTIFITGNVGASFYLEVKNEDTHYYNFYTKTFSSTYARLDGEITSKNGYRNSIVFPRVFDDDQYDFSLFALAGTKHADYNQVRYADGSINFNLTKGSGSLLLQKVIYQIIDVTATISPFSGGGAVTLNSTTSSVTSFSRGDKKNTIKPFSITGTLTSNAVTVDRQPLQSDILSYKELTVSANPLDIEGEDIYPGSGSSSKINGAVTSGAVIQIDALVANIPLGAEVVIAGTTDTVNGDFSGGATAITMDTAVATRMAVGYRVTGTTALDAGLFTVASIDSTNVFSLNASAAIDDGTTLTFKPLTDRSLTTVLSLDPTSGTGFANKLTLSQDVQVIDNAAITFTGRKNYRWQVDSVGGIEEGMHLLTGTNTTANSVIADYVDKTTINANTINEREIVNVFKPAIDTAGYTTTITQGIASSPGSIIFNNQQVLALGGDTIKIGSYGRDQIKKLTGWDVNIKNLTLNLGVVTTTTTAVVNNTTMSVASVLGIADKITVKINMPASSEQLSRYTLTNTKTVLDSVDGLSVGQTLRTMSVGTLVGNPTITAIDEAEKSITLSTTQTFADNEDLSFSTSVVNGIGIDPSVIAPFVSSISSLDLTLSVAQNLESGQTFTFPGAGSTFTITGDVEIKEVGNDNLTLTLDVDKFLTYHS